MSPAKVIVCSVVVLCCARAEADLDPAGCSTLCVAPPRGRVFVFVDVSTSMGQGKGRTWSGAKLKNVRDSLTRVERLKANAEITELQFFSKTGPRSCEGFELEKLDRTLLSTPEKLAERNTPLRALMKALTEGNAYAKGVGNVSLKASIEAMPTAVVVVTDGVPKCREKMDLKAEMDALRTQIALLTGIRSSDGEPVRVEFVLVTPVHPGFFKEVCTTGGCSVTVTCADTTGRACVAEMSTAILMATAIPATKVEPERVFPADPRTEQSLDQLLFPGPQPNHSIRRVYRSECRELVASPWRWTGKPERVLVEEWRGPRECYLHPFRITAHAEALELTRPEERFVCREAEIAAKGAAPGAPVGFLIDGEVLETTRAGADGKATVTWDTERVPDGIHRLAARSPGSGTGQIEAPSKEVVVLNRPAPVWLEDVVAVGSDSGWACSGVVVGTRHVLTARHCLPATRVFFGESLHASGEVVGVVRTRTPPDERVDLALLVLETPRPERVRPRRRATSDPPSGELHLAGFGARDPDGRHEYGFKHQMATASFGASCDDVCDPTHEFLLPGNGGRDTCDGDSGGPVFERLGAPPACAPSERIESAAMGWRLAGITSRAATGARQRCGDGGVYERVDAAAAWLDAELRDQEEGR